MYVDVVHNNIKDAQCMCPFLVGKGNMYNCNYFLFDLHFPFRVHAATAANDLRRCSFVDFL